MSESVSNHRLMKEKLSIFTSTVYHQLSERQWGDRSRTEIARQILEIAKHGSGYSSSSIGKGDATKTWTMYNAFLSHHRLKELIVVLIENDLLSYDSTIHEFKTTEMGVTFLQAYEHIDQMLKEPQV